MASVVILWKEFSHACYVVALLSAKLGVEGTLESADVNLAHGQELRLTRNCAPKGMASLIARILMNAQNSQECAAMVAVRTQLEVSAASATRAMHWMKMA
jgi:hypothetical protein